jgi:hypothetical protein
MPLPNMLQATSQCASTEPATFNASDTTAQTLLDHDGTSDNFVDPAHLQLVHDVDACCSCIAGSFDQVKQLWAHRTMHQQRRRRRHSTKREASSSNSNSSRSRLPSGLADCSMHGGMQQEALAHNVWSC